MREREKVEQERKPEPTQDMLQKKMEVNLLRGGGELKLLSNQSDVRALDGV